MDTTNFSIQTQSRGIIQDDPADTSSSTPNACHRRHDGQFVMPTTPEQFEELVLARIAVVTTAAARSRSPTNFFDASQDNEENVQGEDQTFHRQAMPKEVPLEYYVSILRHLESEQAHREWS